MITDASLRMLNEHSWPGNVRELQNVVERAVIMCGENGMLASFLAHAALERIVELEPEAEAG